MPEDTPDITKVDTHDRGSDGELLPVTETLEIHGDEFEAKIIPATTGQLNEWTQRLENEGRELSDEVTADLLDEFTPYEPTDFLKTADSWSDLRPAITNTLGDAVMARLFDVEDTDEFTSALQEASQQATQGNQT